MNQTKDKVDARLVMPNPSKYYLGKSLEVVKEELEKLGFTKIILKELTKEKGWLSFLAKEHAVVKLSIDGQTDFKKADAFKADATIKITYNVYK